MKTICYYITGHGYGHAVRTIQIVKALPPDVRLILKTTALERLFREDLGDRDFTYLRAEYDCGSVQSDSITVLPRETLTRYCEIAVRNETILGDEVDFLRRENVHCVVTDIPSFPLRAAYEADVPGVAVANFTWHDIYQEYVQGPDDAQLLAEMGREYAQATVALITPLCLPTVTDPFPTVGRVPLVARRGRCVRDSLLQELSRPDGTHLALLYLGVWGLDIAWERLAMFTDWTFLTYEAPPVAVPNVVTLDRIIWPYADTMASLDAVLAKTGYGTVTECIANSVPMIYPPRKGFIEHEALAAGLTRWGGGVPITEADFLAGRWAASLGAALRARPDPNAFATDGADVIARKLMEFCR
ncbi:MAG: hypothetical protein M3Y28_07695 [Armatimonadota bacterium]|nr:hypothetical protein [Armatimonadota bacterium]